jgi:hypothetical protein
MKEAGFMVSELLNGDYSGLITGLVVVSSTTGGGGVTVGGRRDAWAKLARNKVMAPVMMMPGRSEFLMRVRLLNCFGYAKS